MCGACGSRRGTDEWSSALDSRRARWEVARAVDGLLRQAGHPTRVTAAPAGWLVRGATGRTVLADTLTALWKAVGPMSDGAAPIGGPTGSPAAAVHASWVRHQAGAR